MSRHARLAVLLLSSLATQSQLSYAQWPPNGTPVCTAAKAQIVPRIVSDDAGGAIITWHDARNSAPDIFAQHVPASGGVDPAWVVNGTPICVAADQQFQPQIVSDGAGGAILTWADLRTGDGHDIYAQHVLASGAVDPAWTADGTLLCDEADIQYLPQIVSDGAGGAIVTWTDFRNGTDNDVYAQHVLASGGVDPAWASNGTLVCGLPNGQTYSQITSDGAGGAIVTWEDARVASDVDIYAQHVLASGAIDPAWTGGTLLCGAMNDQRFAQIVSDGAGGAIVAWLDFRDGTDYGIYAQHVMASGVVDPAWSVNGTMLCDIAEAMSRPRIINDGAGGAIVTWHDFRTSLDHDVHAQHVLASGVADPAWTANGTLLSSAGSDQLEPTIASDGAGGAIVAWSDSRISTNINIYVQRVLASGMVDPAWTANGTLLCGAPGAQISPEIVSDGAGGAIVAWQDSRVGGNIDVYALRVYGNGAVAAVPSAAAQFAVHAPRPNPAHAQATISFDLATEQRVSVGVYDVTGQRVRALVEDRDFLAGSQNLVWDGTSDAGSLASTGVYFVRVMAGGVSVARRVVFLR